MNSTIIEKEELVSIIFGSEDVLNTDEAKITRRWELQRALSLGNLYRGKVKLFFRNRAGQIQHVETTIWSVTEEYVLLKGGLYIPIKAIEYILA